MGPGIENSSGEKIGEMHVSMPENEVKDGVLLKKVELEVDGKKSEYISPRFSEIDLIDIFGLPPFAEWAIGVEEVEERSQEFYLEEEALKEKLTVERKTASHFNFELERSLSEYYENFSVREILPPAREVSLGIFEVEHSVGECNFTVERTVARNRSEIKKLKRRLDEEEKKYLKKRKREERSPDLVVLKQIDIRGKTPSIQRKIHPFWEKDSWDDEEVKILELGYFDYGDNETELDKQHGRWYKFFTFEDFDHERLEIREGNWKSRKIDVDGEEKTGIENYDKYLYKVD